MKAKLAFLAMARACGLFAVARWWTRDRLRILCYHAFAFDDEADFRPKLFMRPATFESRLQRLGALGFRAVTLDEGMRSLHAGTARDKVVVTIDDGSYSVLPLAVPLLGRYAIPATLYVSTYYVENQSPIFQLLIQYVTWRASGRRVQVPPCGWSDGETIDLGNSSVGAEVNRRIHDYCTGQLRSEAARAACAMEWARVAGVDVAEVVAGRRLGLLSAQELRLVEQAGVDVQMHTHRHRFLPDDLPGCARELAENHASLQSALGKSCRHFCYPSGVWSPQQFDVLRAGGVLTATTCDPGLVRPGDDPLALRRFLDGENLHWLEFESELSGFADALRWLRRAVSPS